jgi:superfamily II DNA/RNA helicase
VFFFPLTTAQEEREYAIKSFKTGKKDVMVASGVASKVRFASLLVYLCISHRVFFSRVSIFPRFNMSSISLCRRKLKVRHPRKSLRSYKEANADYEVQTMYIKSVVQAVRERLVLRLRL